MRCNIILLISCFHTYQETPLRSFEVVFRLLRNALCPKFCPMYTNVRPCPKERLHGHMKTEKNDTTLSFFIFEAIEDLLIGRSCEDCR